MISSILREKDHLIEKLSNDVFALMKDITADEDMRVGYIEPPKQGILATPQSLEDSIKELLAIKNNLK
jgi:hypothetical protein